MSIQIRGCLFEKPTAFVNATIHVFAYPRASKSCCPSVDIRTARSKIIFLGRQQLDAGTVWSIAQVQDLYYPHGANQLSYMNKSKSNCPYIETIDIFSVDVSWYMYILIRRPIVTVLGRSKAQQTKCPAGSLSKNDDVLTSLRRDDVVSTTIQRHFGTKCPLDGTTHVMVELRKSYIV